MGDPSARQGSSREVRGEGLRRDPIRAVKKSVITTMAHSLVRRAISTRSTVTPQQQRVIAAFREAYAEASTTAGAPFTLAKTCAV